MRQKHKAMPHKGRASVVLPAQALQIKKQPAPTQIIAEVNQMNPQTRERFATSSESTPKDIRRSKSISFSVTIER